MSYPDVVKSSSSGNDTGQAVNVIQRSQVSPAALIESQSGIRKGHVNSIASLFGQKQPDSGSSPPAVSRRRDPARVAKPPSVEIVPREPSRDLQSSGGDVSPKLTGGLQPAPWPTASTVQLKPVKSLGKSDSDVNEGLTNDSRQPNVVFNKTKYVPRTANSAERQAIRAEPSSAAEIPTPVRIGPWTVYQSLPMKNPDADQTKLREENQRREAQRKRQEEEEEWRKREAQEKQRMAEAERRKAEYDRKQREELAAQERRRVELEREKEDSRRRAEEEKRRRIEAEERQRREEARRKMELEEQENRRREVEEQEKQRSELERRRREIERQKEFEEQEQRKKELEHRREFEEEEKRRRELEGRRREIERQKEFEEQEQRRKELERRRELEEEEKQRREFERQKEVQEEEKRRRETKRQRELEEQNKRQRENELRKEAEKQEKRRSELERRRELDEQEKRRRELQRRREFDEQEDKHRREELGRRRHSEQLDEKRRKDEHSRKTPDTLDERRRREERRREYDSRRRTVEAKKQLRGSNPELFATGDFTVAEKAPLAAAELPAYQPRRETEYERTLREIEEIAYAEKVPLAASGLPADQPKRETEYERSLREIEESRQRREEEPAQRLRETEHRESGSASRQSSEDSRLNDEQRRHEGLDQWDALTKTEPAPSTGSGLGYRRFLDDPEDSSKNSNEGGEEESRRQASLARQRSEEEEKRRRDLARKKEEDQRRRDLVRKKEEDQRHRDLVKKKEEDQRRRDLVKKKEEDQRRRDFVRKKEEDQRGRDLARKKEEDHRVAKQKSEEERRNREEERRRQRADEEERYRRRMEEERRRQEAEEEWRRLRREEDHTLFEDEEGRMGQRWDSSDHPERHYGRGNTREDHSKVEWSVYESTPAMDPGMIESRESLVGYRRLLEDNDQPEGNRTRTYERKTRHSIRFGGTDNGRQELPEETHAPEESVPHFEEWTVYHDLPEELPSVPDKRRSSVGSRQVRELDDSAELDNDWTGSRHVTQDHGANHSVPAMADQDNREANAADDNNQLSVSPRRNSRQRFQSGDSLTLVGSNETATVEEIMPRRRDTDKRHLEATVAAALRRLELDARGENPDESAPPAVRTSPYHSYQRIHSRGPSSQHHQQQKQQQQLLQQRDNGNVFQDSFSVRRDNPAYYWQD